MLDIPSKLIAQPTAGSAQLDVFVLDIPSKLIAQPTNVHLYNLLISLDIPSKLIAQPTQNVHHAIYESFGVFPE